MNHRSRDSRRQPAVSGLLVFAALAAVVLPSQADAQFTGSASATGQFESNSNIFNLDSGYLQPGAKDFRRGDTDYAYGVELDGKYLSGRQQFFATASTTQYEYQHLTELDHDEYKLDVGMNWVLGALVDGKLDATRTRIMVPFYNLSGESVLALSLATEQRETAQAGLQVTPVWKLEGLVFTSRIGEPVPGEPNLQLTQTSGSTSIDYQGIGNLTSGLTASYLSGSYSGTNGLNPSFDQTTLGLLAKYRHVSLTFEGQVGYTRRDSDAGIDDASGLTGLFDVKKQLTPKTSVAVKVDRVINNYFLNSGSEIDSDAGVSIDWQATYKLDVSLGYTFTYRTFPGQVYGPGDRFQVDYQEFATVGITFQPQRWLLIKPYDNVLTRQSNVIGYDFNSTIVGVSLTVLTPRKGK
jgi:hypothetical protein